jgi:membrane protein
VRRRKRRLVQKYFADRGTHLAAMIAYFALLAFVPLTFLALSLLAFTGRAGESSFLVREINQAVPEAPVGDIARLVRTVQDNAASLGLIGGAFLLWAALSLFSVLESAFNIVYGKPNRPFLYGKGLALAVMIGSLVTLFIALVAGSLGVAALQEWAPWFLENEAVAYALSIAISTLGVFLFSISVYYVLTNEPHSLRDVLPGAAVTTVLLQASFQVLPVFLRYTELNPVMKTFGSPVILLVWLYVMSNVLVFGAELNWWRKHSREPTEEEPEAAGLA